MANLKDVVEFLNHELDIETVPDYPGALNGLQLENEGKVTKVAAAVDASLPVFEKAVGAGVDLLIVHHGMFWQGAQRVAGAHFKKLKLAMDSGMAVYSAHIPLDVHPQWGNNVQLAAKLGMRATETFFSWKGIELGVKQDLDIPFGDLVERASKLLRHEVHTCPAGNQICGTVGIITGGTGSEVAAVQALGIDTFITGEGPHWSYPLAEELGVNVIYGGHYETETLGVKVLAEEVAERYDISSIFVDHPTGL